MSNTMYGSAARRTIAVAVLAASAGVALAHDFWVQPSKYRPEAHAPISARLFVGDRFVGASYARNPKHIDRFELTGPDGAVAVTGSAGADPAGTVRVGRAGTYVLGYRSRRSAVELDAEKFEDYLRHEGLEHVVRERAARGESAAVGREVFSRCAKSVLRVGDGAAKGHDRRLGFPLEVVPEADPYALEPGAKLAVRVYYDGKPLANTLVSGHHEPGKDAVVSGRTDAGGRVRLRLGAAGEWMLNTVHMVRAPKGVDAEWESFWASLTFELPEASEDAAGGSVR